MNKPVHMEDWLKTAARRTSSPAGLGPFFSPRGVAVIGASPKPGNLGRMIVESMRAQGFVGKIATVHPKGLEIPQIHAVRSVDELPEETDLAIAAVSASNVPGLIEPLAKRGIRHLIVIGGGFSETGEAGRKLQEALRVAGKKFGARVVGPNCMGVFSAPDRFNSFFLSPRAIAFPNDGPIALVSQSGALLSLILDQMSGLGIGVHRAVSFGNRVDVEECELIEEFAKDPAVKAIGVYLEGVQNGQRFVEAARRAGAVKPVAIWKGGHDKRGADAARSHSAALSGSYEAFRAACAKAGLIEVQSLQEFNEALQVLALQPPVKGDRVLIVSNGGGMGVLLTDLCEKAGLSAPVPSGGVLTRLRSVLPEYYSFNNPIDLTGSGTNEQCVFAVEQLVKSGEYDCLLMVLLSGAAGLTPDIALLLKDRLPRSVPVVLGAYGRDMLTRLREVLVPRGVPVFASAEESVRALSALVRRFWAQKEAAVVESDPDVPPFDSFPEGWTKWIARPTDEMQTKKFLEQCGVQVPPSRPARCRDDLKTAMEVLRFPMALKAVGEEIKHKTESKGVRLNLLDKESLFKAWEEMSSAWPGKIWVEWQAPPGLDLMVGAYRDPQFGPLLLFGTGGSYVELYEDIERILLPATTGELTAMISRTRAGRIVRGIRGSPPLDEKRLVHFLKLAADWMVREPRLESLDFNPVRLYPEGLLALDAKVSFAPVSRKE
ncbi:MAG: acetate--CoA ligase family protein [Nitrospinae bacterium]|nr:acetate--CoA ligase family protein [Nitrospinota bacterium]